MPNQNQHGGASGSGAKPVPKLNPQPTQRPRDLLDLLRSVQTFYTTDELDLAVRTLVDDPVGGLPAARAALHDHFK